MRGIRCLVLGLALVFVAGVLAADEVLLKGSITCAKCDLKVKDQKKCATVIKVKDGDKDVVYYFDADSHKKNHSQICTTPKEGSVKGEVSEKDGKKMVKVSKIEFKD